MSRIGKQPIVLPESVTATVRGQVVTFKGPKGELQYTVHPNVAVTLDDNQLICSLSSSGQDKRVARQAVALWGTTRARLNNMARGVHEGWRKELELHGVGYRASLKGGGLELMVGFSHPVTIDAPQGITFAVDQEIISVEGVDNVLVGQVAADIRSVYPPEPYKGKGIRYRGELVRRKVGKVMGTEV